MWGRAGAAEHAAALKQRSRKVVTLALRHFPADPKVGPGRYLVQLSRLALIGGGACAAVALAPRAATVAGDRLRIVILAAAVVLLAIGVGLPAWDHEILGSGAYLYARSTPEHELDAVLRAGTIKYYRDGAAATVSVRQLAGSLSVAIDGKINGSNGADMLTQRLRGMLPALLHGHPGDACIIGLGTGVTAASLLATGQGPACRYRRDFSRSLAGIRFLFERKRRCSEAASGAIDRGRRPVASVVDQSAIRRPHLRTLQSLDGGVAALFTREFFEAARARLKSDGIFCQWVHTYDIRAIDLQSIVHTFATVFPQATVWRVDDGDLLMIGGTGPSVESRLANVREHWRVGSVPAALSDVGIHDPAAPFELLSLYAGGPMGTRALWGWRANSD